MKQTLKGGKHQGKYYARIVLRKKKNTLPSHISPIRDMRIIFFGFPADALKGKKKLVMSYLPPQPLVPQGLPSPFLWYLVALPGTVHAPSGTR